MLFICFLISFFASTVGAVSGIGGGIIIKPVLDATGILSVSTISFLSGCTVLVMAIVSLLRSRGNGVRLEMKISSFLALGAVVGGLLGKELFEQAKALFATETQVGLVQSIILAIMTLVVLVYCLRRDRIKTYHLTNWMGCLCIGLLLGLLSAFLGIGGGPMNIAVLYLFFSMNAKTAAKNSIYIILFSQLSSFIRTVADGSVPVFDPLTLVLMIFGGIAGALLGSTISKKLSTKQAEIGFLVLLVLIILITVYNVIRFSLA